MTMHVVQIQVRTIGVNGIAWDTLDRMYVTVS